MKWLGSIAMAVFIIGSCSPQTNDGLFAGSSPIAAKAGTSGGQK